eukprot:TRINITY_DN68256_c0_g1_i1.p1 TRINITY_DN68256_c0_g1~~TRINITY_DN68256_c0_g1_i1.p1  ORF type:complete len:427 (-),score=80.44 TRINITY_DN68256_c0_g1_i1:149-1429(-)
MADHHDIPRQEFDGKKFSFPKHKIKAVLLEAVHERAVEMFKAEGYVVDSLPASLSGQELIERVKDAHIIGVRSKTRLTAEVLKECRRLKSIGCFCIGTDQTDLPAAELLGVPVFNSPYSNSRSVAELVLSHIISLSRRVPEHIRDMHRGVWNKTAKNCCEIRGKTLGIVGYGHIGTQLSIMAEAMGMRVIFHDIQSIMPLGNARQVGSLEELIKESHYLSLHVPDTDLTRGMIGAEQLKLMPKNSYLLNLSRGTVVDLDALAEALNSGHLAGCAVDVYPKEPAANGDMSTSPDVKIPLIGCKNTILTPHIGGSTEEAQLAIGVEVATKIIAFLNQGKTELAVNFPNITPVPFAEGTHRILNIHENKPGVLRAINDILSGCGNITYQVLSTTRNIGYLVVDVEAALGDQVKERMAALPYHISTRILY